MKRLSELAELLWGMGPVGVPLEVEAPGADADSFWIEGERRGHRGETWTIERPHGARNFYTFCADPDGRLARLREP